MTGVDVNQTKVDIINAGESPIMEFGTADLISEMIRAGRLRATADSAAAVRDSDLSLICVGTPSQADGSLDLTYVKRVCQQIGAALQRGSGRHTVALRSTVLPGTIESTVVPTLEAYSGKTARRDFGVCINPEFLREGSSLEDFYAPPFTLVGTNDEEAAAAVGSLYSGVRAPLIITSFRVAEFVKYSCNCFHALKVSFANEIGNLCKELEIDSREVMGIFCRDTKLNLSSHYLKPGFAFGGSCLPKDLRAVIFKAKELNVDVPVLAATLSSNNLQLRRAVEMVLRAKKNKIGVLGFSFKSGTDDLRESPMVELIEILAKTGMKLAIYDPDVQLAHLLGANKEYIEREIPHVSQLMRASTESVLEASEVIVLGKKAKEFGGILGKLRPKQVLIDLANQFGGQVTDKRYHGICW